MIDLLTGLGLFPEQASTIAGRVDALYGFLLGISGFFGILIATLIVVFALRYRRSAERVAAAPKDEHSRGTMFLEIAWTGIPFVLSMIIFLWSASVYFAIAKPPEDALEVFVVGKQWMWKLQHMEGRREINELHVPVGHPVKLTMTSEDVIHSFYVPAFRVKADVLPGRYTQIWFEPTREGTYHLFCAEFCGTEHSRMIGRIVAMPPAAYQSWLAGPTAGSADAGPLSAALAGRQLFERNGCPTCHTVASDEPRLGRAGPPLHGLFGREVHLERGRIVTVDEAYLRRSILDPRADVVAGYEPIMPTYAGRLTEEDVLLIVAYLRSLAADTGEESARGSRS